MDDSSDEEMEIDLIRHKTYLTRINFDTINDREFVQRYRLRPSEVDFVLSIIGPRLQPTTMRSHALTPKQQLLTTLHWLAIGCPFHAIGDLHGLRKGTVSKVVKKVVDAINQTLSRRVIKWPTETDNISLEFFRKGGFPNVCGAVDGTLIPMQSPTEHEDQYVDRHGKHSINAMMICGPDYTFYYVNARFPGSVHDARVLRTSQISEKFQNGWRPFPNAVVLGDSGYGLKSWLIPPLHRNPNDEAERKFNVAHKRTRRLVENAIGILKNRFQCLKYLRLDPVRAVQVILACVTLHNIARKDDFPILENVEPEVDNNDPVEDEVDGSAQARLEELLAFFRN